MADKTEMQNQDSISLLSFGPIIPLLDVLRRWYLIAAIAQENYEESQKVLEKTESILNQGFYLGL